MTYQIHNTGNATALPLQIAVDGDMVGSVLDMTPVKTINFVLHSNLANGSVILKLEESDDEAFTAGNIVPDTWTDPIQADSGQDSTSTTPTVVSYKPSFAGKPFLRATVVGSGITGTDGLVGVSVNFVGSHSSQTTL